MKRLPIVIRRAGHRDASAVKALVARVVDDTYGHLWSVRPFSLDHEDWQRALVAVTLTAHAGIVLTQGAFVTDLWVLRHFWSRGVGSALLAAGEAEIGARGHTEALLRVVEDNTRAVDFYRRHGWRTLRSYRHELLPVTMLEMRKALAPTH